MGGRVQNALSAGENFVDEFDLAEAFNVFRFQQLAEALPLRFENAFGCCIERGVSVNVVVNGRD